MINKYFNFEQLNNLTNHKPSLLLLYGVVICCFYGCKELPPLANFDMTSTTISKGESINFNNLSARNPKEWEWTFEGGTPSSSNDAHPSGIVYTNPGTYEVILTVSNNGGSDTKTKTILVEGTTLGGDTSFVENRSLNQLLADGVGMDTILELYPVDSVYGKQYRGGLFFYYADGEGYVAKESDEPNRAPWGCDGVYLTDYTCSPTEIGGRGHEFNSCFFGNTAIGICDDLIHNGYSDWQLPTALTLFYMYQNLHRNGYGNFSGDYAYWSSCYNSSRTAKTVSLVDGTTFDAINKGYSRYVRAIRKI